MTFALPSILEAIFNPEFKIPGKSGSARLPRGLKLGNLYPPLSVGKVHLRKFLFVYIDCHLTWRDHMQIEYIWGKISKNITIVVKLKHHDSKANTY